MLFWTFAALMTIGALLVVLLPLMRRSPPAAPTDAVEVALYRSQMAAIETEERAGRIQPDDAEATRTEVKRRMLAAARQRAAREMQSPAPVAPGPRARRMAALVIGVAVPLIAVGIYVPHGRPDLPDQPYAARGAERAAAGMPSDQEMALVQQLAERMAAHPEDPRGWLLLGGAYLRQGRYDEAVAAYQNASSRKPNDAEILSALGEAVVLQSGGEVTEDARGDFDQALKIDPTNVRARYFGALADAQAGNYGAAISGWTAMLTDAPKDAPWRAQVEGQLKAAQQAQSEVGSQLGPDITSLGATLSPQQRQAMIESMVNRLADRLKAAPQDLSGWLRLARSYVVLGRPDEASAALDQAAEHFKGDEKALAQIEQARTALQMGPSDGATE